MTPAEFGTAWAPRMESLTPRERRLVVALAALVDHDLAFLSGYVCSGQVSRADVLQARDVLQLILEGAL